MADAAATTGSEPEGLPDLLIARRVGRRLGLIDLDGYISCRVDDRVLVASRPVDRSPWRLEDADVRVYDLHADERPEDPLGIGLTLAVHRARPDVGAIAWGTPPTALAFGSTGRDILPLTHTWATFVHEGTGWLEPGLDDLHGDRAATEAVVRDVAQNGQIHVPGIALVTFGEHPIDALRRLDALEYLARMTRLAGELASRKGGRVTTVSQGQAAAIDRQRPVEAVPSRDYRRYYRSLDRPLGPSLVDRWPATDREAVVRRDVALACRLLAAAGDLVAFFEHVSHRILGDPGRFAMSPATDFKRMAPEDIGILSTSGDCEQLSGPLPAAPFRWYHRDILAARPDVEAIVHTHELTGRAFILAGATSGPIHTSAVHGLGGAMPPVAPEVTLGFDEGHRRALVGLLGSGPWVHSLGHGTDFVAADLATATVGAISWDAHLRFASVAASLGTPRTFTPSMLEHLRGRLAGPAARWQDLVDALDA